MSDAGDEKYFQRHFIGALARPSKIGRAAAPKHTLAGYDAG
jgi:hypothetical protein